MIEKNSYCCKCDKPAVWIRHTQFSGDHPFCQEHAKQETDFGNCNSYFWWGEIPPEERAPKHPNFIQIWDIEEHEFPELARQICNMEYDKIVKLHGFYVEAFRMHFDEAVSEGKFPLAAQLHLVITLMNEYVEDLEDIFEECKKFKECKKEENK